MCMTFSCHHAVGCRDEHQRLAASVGAMGFFALVDARAGFPLARDDRNRGPFYVSMRPCGSAELEGMGRVGSRCERTNLFLQSVGELVPSHLKIVATLQIEPEFGFHCEE